MSNDDLSAIEEELAATRSELETLQVTAADREARAVHLESQQSDLREQLAEAQSEAEARAQELAVLGERAQTLESQARSGAERYRELALEQSPELPHELVTGETVEEVDEALQRARETVSKVRGHLESQAQAGRVPVGAPPRSGPDLSAMSAEDKIRYGIEQVGR